MIFAAIAKDIYSRLLDRIYASSSLLFAASVLDRDFVHKWTSRLPDGSGDSSYTLPDGTPFEPVFVGSVDSTEFGGAGLNVVLGLPAHATDSMKKFFEKQLSSLTAVVAARCDLTPDVGCEDVIPWNYSPIAGVGRIHIFLRPGTPTRRCTPGRCLATGPSPPSSACSTSSSSTLSSTDDYVTTAPEIECGDLLVVQCKMICRDFPRPDNLVVRVFSLYVTKVVVVV
ncbi:hypothetical protein B0H16DRAFT_1729154 [Mycena metata]|uniref:Uncharacterized protein n=1 Tax=Mycena metata TaxID=1033252 RepID=A0AAD7IEQ5_9AGAR|nr:hypothetical protein B0H16DRAFT_1729154 [Mycena metata]